MSEEHTLTWKEVREVNDLARRLKAYLIKAGYEGFQLVEQLEVVITKTSKYLDPPKVVLDLGSS
ncbi:unnamed protein product [marine sediment metagenome]|uniref:Uncharacterized protein n=1 Tax=marine sediment metagenome TaxID=412755 RepID=X1DSY7_9ZZZZ